MQLSVVILAKTDREDLFRMTLRCIDSLYASESFRPEVIIVESNKNYYESGFLYPDEVKIIIPKKAFNFHRFLNIGVAASSGDFIALCNNDLVFHPNWFGAMNLVAQKNRDILSFSPVGEKPLAKTGKFTIGHRAMIHLMGWCFVVRRGIFNTIGPLDETFDFYYADNDYGMTLRYHNIKHALVHDSYVEHLERQSEPKKVSTTAREQAFVKNYNIPEFLKDPQYAWVFDSEKYLSGILKYHGKWGSPKWLYRKNKVADWLMRFHLGFLNRLFLKI